EKDLVITALKEQLDKLKGKAVLTEAVSLNPIDPALLLVDVVLLVPKLRQNRTAHTDYIRHTQEEAATLREIAERTKLVAVTPKNKTKQIRRTAQITKSKRTTVATSPSPNIGSNTPVLSSTRVTLVSSASGSKSQDNTKKNRIRQTQKKAKKTELEDHLRTVNSSLNKASVVDTKATSYVIKKVWKSTEKVFKTVGYIWKPTGRTFTLVGNVCPLTRIATATIVPHREPIPIVNSTDKPVVTLAVQIVLWYLDPGCSKHMTGDRSQLINFVQKFLGTVKFGNDHVAKIMGYGDYQIRNVTISRVYFMEGLGHNLFFVGKFCDLDLEVSFRQHTCFIRNLDGVDLLTGSQETISCTIGKSIKKTHKPKSEDTNQEKLYLLHMDLCGPMRVESVNGKKYILVIMDDYSRFTWVKFLRSKDETPMFIITFLKMIQAEAVATTCFTQNRSIIRLRHGKTPYELMHDKQLDLSFFHVFGALCYLTNDSENVGLVQKSSSSASYVPPSRNDWDFLFQQMFDELRNPPPSVVNQAAEVIAPIAKVIPQVDADS
nr:hypothetical protein [Tanacetum cinerariifolium]